MEVKFHRPVLLQESLSYVVTHAEPVLRFRVVGPDGSLRTEMTVELSSGDTPRFEPLPRGSVGTCRALSFEEAREACGEIPLGLDAQALRSLFPELAEHLPSWQVDALLATSRMVGMDCPGLYSLFGSMRLRFTLPHAVPSALGYRAIRHDPRFRCVWYALELDGMQGDLRAYHRPPP